MRVGLARLRWPALILIVAAITVSELVVSLPVFRSEYNFFDLG